MANQNKNNNSRPNIYNADTQIRPAVNRNTPTQSRATRSNATQQRPSAKHSNANGATRVNAVASQNNPHNRNAGSNGTPNSPMPNGNGNKNKKNKNDGESKGKKVFFGIMKTFVTLACIAIIAGCLIGIQAVKYVVETTKDDNIVLDLERMSRSQTGYVWATNPNTGERFVYQKLVGEQDSQWIPFKDIPQTMKDAIISVEDQKFYDHSGVNIPRSIYAGLNSVFKFKPTFGASTIDQQLIKNLTGDSEQDSLRKLREMFRAWGLNNKYSKDMILEAYLNTLPLSGVIVGVQTGAREYFNKDLTECTLPEFALMAGITKAPGNYNPFVHPENALNRRNVVLKMMFDNGKITESEYEWAKNEPLGLNPASKTPQQEAASKVNDYFMDALYEQVTQAFIDAGIVDNKQAAYHLYYNGGINIEATVNPVVQQALEEVYSYEPGSENSPFPGITALYEDEPELTQSAMVVINVEDGSVAGIVGGVGEKEASLTLNRAFTPRPIGSTMKAIGPYAMAIDYGIINYSLMLLDAPVASRNPSNPQKDAAGNIIFDWPYNVNEYGRVNNVNVPVCDAVAKSYNTIAARVAQFIGADAIYEFLEESLKFTDLVEDDKNLSPMALGSLTYGVTAYELAAAYAMFGNGGVYNTPFLFYEITDSYGNLILKPEAQSSQSISEESAYIMNKLLHGVLRSSGSVNGTARGMAPEYLDSIGKTGTTDDNKDRWFAGVTPYYSAVVWWGFDHNMKIENPPQGVNNPPVIAWKRVMEMIQADLPEKSFPEKPEGVLESAFCRETGLLAGARCTQTQTGYYQELFVPDECNAHGDIVTD